MDEVVLLQNLNLLSFLGQKKKNNQCMQVMATGMSVSCLRWREKKLSWVCLGDVLGR